MLTIKYFDLMFILFINRTLSIFELIDTLGAGQLLLKRKSTTRELRQLLADTQLNSFMTASQIWQNTPAFILMIVRLGRTNRLVFIQT